MPRSRDGLFGRPFALLVLAGVLMASLVRPALAGPVADFEAAMRRAYGDYRAALFLTNQKNAEGSMQALAAFESRWRTLATTLRTSVPPQYQGDPKVSATLDAVDALVAKAKAEIGRGDTSAAHETLEGIRDQWSDLRARNGIIGFSDRMNAYHTAMEHVLLGDHGSLDGAALARLREEAAVLAYLVGQIEANPAPDAADPTYAPMVAALRASVEALLGAVRAGDSMATRAAIAGLKAPYARLFLKFG